MSKNAHVQVTTRGNAQALYCMCLEMCYVFQSRQWSIFSSIAPLPTRGSFTFMVIQIMKLSIRGILWWEQWTQLPPTACEMGWQTLRQMGEPALGRQSNHIHLARFPFPLFMCSAVTYQQAKEPELPTSHTSTTFANADTFPLVHLIPQPPLTTSHSQHRLCGLWSQLEEGYVLTNGVCGGEVISTVP